MKKLLFKQISTKDGTLIILSVAYIALAIISYVTIKFLSV
jgi:hypothetical protein